jgi:tetratricopeptide (TPR) repeat protein
MFAAAGAMAQNLPAGTHSVDAPTPDDAGTAQIREAETALEQQNYKSAEATLQALMGQVPEAAHNGRVLYDLGFAEEHLGKGEAAAQAYAAAIKLLPGFAEPQVALGLLDARAGRLDAAHSELMTASKLESAAPATKARALRALARLDEDSNPQAAQDELLQALKLTPETVDDVLLGASLAERAGDYPDAEAAYRRALVNAPDDVNAIAGLAHTLQAQQKLPEADAVLTPALKQYPDDPRLVAQAASLYAAEGKASEAIPLLEKMRAGDAAIAADPKVTRMLAGLYIVAGKDDDALRLDEQLLAASPNDPALLDEIGTEQVRVLQYAAAEATLLKAAAMRSAFHHDKAWALCESHLAFAASKNKDPKTSLLALQARSTVLPDIPSTLFLEAIAYDSLRQREEAKRAYKAFLASANGKYPDEEFEARHRLIALQNEH